MFPVLMSEDVEERKKLISRRDKIQNFTARSKVFVIIAST